MAEEAGRGLIRRVMNGFACFSRLGPVYIGPGIPMVYSGIGSIVHAEDGGMKVYLIYALAAGAEIAGCFSFWAWLKLACAQLPAPLKYHAR